MKIITKSATMARFTLSVLLAVCATVAWVLPANATGNINNVRGEDVFDNGVFIGDEQSTGTSYYMPVNVYYNYSLIQQIYTPEEIGMAGTITSLAFDYTYSEAFSMEGVKVYMKEVYKEEFSSGLDLVAVGDDDLVFEGTFEADGAGWVTINLDTPFTYNGEGNLLVCFYDPTDGYPGSAYKFRTTPTEQYLAAGQYSDSNVPDPANPGNFNGSKGFWQYRTNIVIGITPSSDIIVTMPSSLEATEVNGHDVTLAWDGGTELYNLEYRKKTDEQWTSVLTNSTIKTHTITGLAAETEYQARVQSVGWQYATSIWKTVSFTTPVAVMAPSDVTMTLTPGDGTVATIDWTDNAQATEWLIEYKPTEAEAFESTSTTQKPYTLTGLTPELEYTVQVRAWSQDLTETSSPSPAVTFTPTNAYMLTVNDGTNTNQYVPIYGYWADKNTKSQFIIPSDELQDIIYGKINKLTFYASQENISWVSDTKTAVFKVYLGEVDETAFESEDNLYDLGDLENVYEGTLEVSDHEMTVNFGGNYQYMGGNLLIAFDQTEVGKFQSVTWYGVSTDANTAVGGYNTSLSVQKFLPKTTIWYDPSEAPVCLKPTDVTVSDITAHTAVVSWTSDEPSFDIMVNQEIIVNVTNPYTIENLQPTTIYTIQVRAKNDDGESDWTKPLRFETDLEGEKCLVTLELFDSYGDGWNGNAIQVVDALTGYVFGTATIENLSDEKIYTSATELIPVTDGREVNFVWVKGNYPSECSFTILDPSTDVMYQIAKGDASSWADGYVFTTYTVDCKSASVRRPTDLAIIDKGPHDAVLNWTENGEATEWLIVVSCNGEVISQNSTITKPFTITGLDPETTYSVKVSPRNALGVTKWSDEITFTTTVAAPTPTYLAVEAEPFSATAYWQGMAESYNVRFAPLPEGSAGYLGEWVLYDNGSSKGGINGANTWGVMYPADMVTGNRLAMVSIFETSGNSADITMKIYSGGDTAPGTLLYTETFTPEAANAFQEVTLAEPVDIPEGENVWITLTETGSYVLTCCECSEPNNSWVYTGDSWSMLGDLSSDLAGYGWMIRGYFETQDFDEETLDWTTATVTNNVYEMTELEQQTAYVVQVQGNYGEDGPSPWVSVAFTTPEANMVPTDLAVVPDINSATVGWTGNGQSYDLQYRKAAIEFYDGFEDGLDNWAANIDADEDGYPWMTTANLYDWSQQYAGYQDMSSYVYKGNVSALSGSFINNLGTLYPDNFLVSPRVNLGGAVSFWAMPADQNYPAETFGIFVSTSDDAEDVDSYVEVKSWTMTTGDWRLFSADLSQFSGQGYLALRNYNGNDQYMVLIDEFVITSPVNSAKWTTVTTPVKEHNLTGLEPETFYEVRVCSEWDGVKSNYSDIVPFQTLPFTIPTAIVDITATEGNGDWYSIDGKKLNARPKAKGLYIRDGQKVVVK